LGETTLRCLPQSLEASPTTLAAATLGSVASYNRTAWKILIPLIRGGYRSTLAALATRSALPLLKGRKNGTQENRDKKTNLFSHF